MLKVVKFGGSSLADAAQFEKVRQIITADPARRVVVVSAPGKRFSADHKITDLLYLCYAHLQYGVSAEGVFSMVVERYRSIVADCGLSADIDKEFLALYEKMQQGISQDELVSRGEYFAARLMAEYLGFDFLDAAEWLQFSFDGQIDREHSYEALRRIAEDRSVVIPGFYGVMPDGHIKVLSRGGSDVTGALAAAALGADVYENWTDVSGFLVTDPRIVKDPEVISTITYRELRELSYMGATVLHEDSIFPLRQEGIPIHVLNTNAPQDPGTMIVENTCSKPKFTITGIAGKKGFASITVEKSMMNTEIGFGRKVLGVFEDNNLSFEHMPSGIDTMTVFVHQNEFAEKEQQVIAGLHRAVQPDSIDLESDLALIAVVGRGMRRTRGTAGRIFSALAHKNINVKMIDQGSSELNIIIGVANDDFETAIKAIYDIFVITRL